MTISPRYRPIAEIVVVTGRPKQTIYTWVREERVPHIKHRGIVYVDLPAAYDLSQHTGRRNRAAA